MSKNKNTPRRNVEFKEYPAKPVIKGYNPQKSIQQRNHVPIRKSYNAQQMVQTANNQSAPQLAQQSKSNKTSKGQK